MENFENKLIKSEKILNNIRGIFENNNISQKLKEIENIILDQNFWKDKNKAKKIVKEKNYEDILNSYKKSVTEISNLKDLYNLAIEEKNEEILQDCSTKIGQIFNVIKKNEIRCFLSGENDDLNIYLEIHAGAGGTESQDWADMLRRMYYEVV